MKSHKWLSIFGVIYVTVMILVFPALLKLPPAYAENFIVVSSRNSGSGTLRWALSNATAASTITFSPSMFLPNNPTIIYIQSALPTINQNGVIIDASNAGVILDGSQAPAGTNGLIIEADNTAVRGLIIRNFKSNGIYIHQGASGNTIGGNRSIGTAPHGQGNVIVSNGANGVEIVGSGTNNNLVQGNYIGIDSSGLWDLGNMFNGIAVWQGAASNIVGGTNSNLRNVISGNEQNGIWMAGTGTNGNRILGNYVGTRANGLEPVTNGFAGVSLQDGTFNNWVGDSVAGGGNLISGNSSNGVYLNGAGTINNRILGNIIGLNYTGMAVIGQGYNGILLQEGASNNIIGDGSQNGRNIISGNSYHGILIENSTTSNNIVQGNYIGSNINGTQALANGLHGIGLNDATHHNLIGGNRLQGKGNLLSGNSNHGLVITENAYENTALGNLIGTDATGTYSLGGHPYGGIDIANGAHDNHIGGMGTGEGNLISGNNTDGIALFDNGSNGTRDNEIIKNLIGVTLDGNSPLPNNGMGIFHVVGAANTTISGNTISGNNSHGIQLSGSTSTNATITGNYIGTNSDGTAVIANKGNGIYITEAAHGHLVQDNTIGGNSLSGIVLEDLDIGQSPHDNTIQQNFIGINNGGVSMANNQDGIRVLNSTYNTVIGPGNVISFNKGYGVYLQACNNNTVTQNSIYNNGSSNIYSLCLAPPQLKALSTMVIQGSTVPSAQVEYYSDNANDGSSYAGTVIADATGTFTLTGPFVGPNVTAIATNTNGSTSGYSNPVHLEWTILLYLNGDNDLEDSMQDTLNHIALQSSPRANVLVLLDRYTTTITLSKTILYDVTYGEAISIAASLGISNSVPNELNMGDGQTLVDFVTWGKSYYPAQHTLLSIVDHGGGWAPSPAEPITGTLPIHHTDWLAGNSGLSFDFSDGYDYLDSGEIRQAMAEITNSGNNPIDVVFYDVCLMGLGEVAYELKDFASYFVSSQNIGWAPVGPQGRYVRIIQGLTAGATPEEMGQLIVQSYADSIPEIGHPFTVSAVDLSLMSTLAFDVSQLATAISQTLTISEQATGLQELQDAYLSSQKIDYDSDFVIENETDGFVDLYDFALNVVQQFSEPTVTAAAQLILTTLDSASVAEAHNSGEPWALPGEYWDLDNVHGLSIYLPLGEDLELPIVITETVSVSPTVIITRNLRLRDLYTSNELQFVGATSWGAMIDRYYESVSLSVDITGGPVAGLQIPDVNSPTTAVTYTGAPQLGEMIQITWVATDTQSGVANAYLWHKPPQGEWSDTGMTQEGEAGVFSVSLSEQCWNSFSVRAIDKVGNIEDLEELSNIIRINVDSCRWLYLPFIAK